MESKAYTQAYVIIQNLSEEIKKQIPISIIDAIKSKMDLSYEFIINDDEIEDIELLEDTEKILSVIYTDYIANGKEKEVLKQKELSIFLQEEKEKQSKYSNIVFPHKQEKIQIDNQLEVKPKWYIKIINIIKNIFKK